MGIDRASPQCSRWIALVAGLVLTISSGCAGPEKPRATTGDPAVFTMLHIAAAQSSESVLTNGQASSVRDDMLRYFRSTSTEYKTKKLRADDMLDGKQAAQSTAQLVISTIQIAAELKWLNVGGEKKPAAPATQSTTDTTSNAGDSKKNTAVPPKNDSAETPPSQDPPASNDQETNQEPTLTANDKIALEKALTEAVIDSPFDSIDRAYDFYTSLHLKTLMMYGHDTRALDGDQLWAVVQGSAVIRSLRKIELQSAELNAVLEKLKNAKNASEELKKEIEALQKRASEVQSNAKTIGSGLPIIRTHSLIGDLYSTSDHQDASAEVIKMEYDDSLKLVEKLEGEYTALSKAINEPPKAPAQTAWPENTKRLLYLVFPISVSPGTAANYSTGVRIRIRSTTSCHLAVDNGNAVKVVSLHPQRTYDLESQIYIDLAKRIIDTSIALKTGNTELTGFSGDASASNNTKSESQARRNFLQRMSKQGAYVNATNNEFGWNFFPTKLQVDQVSFWGRVADFFTGRSREFAVNAYLDGGLYNCAAYVVVPPDLTSFTFSTEYVYAEIDQDGRGGREKRFYIDKNGDAVEIKPGEHPTDIPKATVTLPKLSFYELDAMYSQAASSTAPPAPEKPSETPAASQPIPPAEPKPDGAK